jgi:hypothetical protein
MAFKESVEMMKKIRQKNLEKLPFLNEIKN